jgi:dephospho-CoA kinase
MNQNVKVIGITGGIASGKSTIAEILRSFGANVINADKICHQIINTKDIAQKIINKWGTHIQNEYGNIERQSLAKIVFSDKKEISALNKIIHPVVIKEIESRIAKLKKDETTKAIVLDAALLLESNLADICDTIIFVDTKKDLCKKRVMISRMWSSDEIDKREQHQDLLRKKRDISNMIIDNNKSKTDTANQVKDFWCRFITKVKIGE